MCGSAGHDTRIEAAQEESATPETTHRPARIGQWVSPSLRSRQGHLRVDGRRYIRSHVTAQRGISNLVCQIMADRARALLDLASVKWASTCR